MSTESGQPSDLKQEAAGFVVEDATCTACGCLCDDLILVVEGGRIVEARNACALGRSWFLADHAQAGLPTATVDGRPVEAAEAVRCAAEVLGRARAPVVLGLTRTTTEAVAEALALADRIGASVATGDPEDAIPHLLAVQRVGRVSATLGEVKQRADVVVFWGVDPVVTHPRHWERYSVEPSGRFVPRGRADRTVIVADAERTATAERADRFVRVAADVQLETLWTLRALVRGVELDTGHVARATGLDLATLRDLAERLKAARYGAWLIGAGLGRMRGGASNVEAALRLVRDLNASTRFVILNLGGPGNAPGAESVLTWQTGYASSVSFARGVPESIPDATSAVTLLARGASDAALIVADDVETWLPEPARAHLDRIPRIVIAPRATATDRPPRVALASATYGIDAPGTVTRTDGVVLPLRPPLTASVPTDRQWLRMLADRLSELDQKD